ncbi:MAG: hypothetical protein AAF191_19255, partial [Verrucomicrobiota bacterium]
MFQDAIQKLMECQSGPCLIWHGTLGLAAAILGVWMAFEVWGRPWREGARSYALRQAAQAKEARKTSAASAAADRRGNPS